VTILLKVGMLDFSISLTIFVSMLIGGYIGSHLAIKKGASWARHLISAMIIIVAIKMIVF
ncbi:MAG: hypothetical protein WCO23_02275, partial [bacterium]